MSDSPANARSLELPHRRGETSTWTGDHELDVVIEPDGPLQLKDEDDLKAAVAAGLFTPVQAERIHQNAKLAGESFANGDWPFAPGRPDQSWPLPELPADAG